MQTKQGVYGNTHTQEGMGGKSMGSTGLFHQLLKGNHQLVDHFVLAVSNVRGHAGADMVAQQLLVEGVDRRGDRRRRR